MDVKIQQPLLLFFIFIFPSIIESKNSCPFSTCGNNFFTIKYPFKLQTDHPPKNCRNNFIDLTCSDEGRVMINLPSSGSFYVTSINYYLQRIALTDPGNCLLGRLMVLNFSASPLDAVLYERYTYYTCPQERVKGSVSEIDCLSNSTYATVAATGFSREFMREVYGCEPIVSSLIPLSSPRAYNYLGNLGDLQLTWNVFGCSECDGSGDSKSKLAKLLRSTPFIVSAAVLAPFFGVACLLCIITRLIVGRATTTQDADGVVELSSATSTAGAPPQATGTTSGELGTENSDVKSFSEVGILSDSQGTLPSCSICLHEYCGEDKVRNLARCGHYFHVECIDQWVKTSTTCPVCRASFS